MGLPDGERLTLKVEEAAGLLGIGREKTRLLCNSGVIPSLRLGRRLVIPKARFLRWLDDPASQQALAAQDAR
ncbi:MAG: helix-turn-helix domain-containing protein [Chloroflexi bacterium]|nr:MAG: helix-turn-helix domain-containing protein [Chloroflexota bacterium]